MAHPVTWFMIQGSDAKVLEDFYRAVFQWKMQPSPDGTMQMVAKEEGGINGGIGKSMTGGPAVSVYIDTHNIEETLATIERHGGKTVMPPMELPANMGRIAGFMDPGGNWTGLWQPGPGATPPASARRAPKRTAKKTAKKAAKKPAARKAKKPAAKKAKKPAAKKAAKKAA